MDNNNYDDFNFEEMVTEGNTLDQTDDIVETLLQTEWITEAKQIPFEDLTSEEQQIVNKCINRETFTPIELESLEEILARYRTAIREQKPDLVIQNVEDNIELFNDERYLIDLYKQSEKTNTLDYVLTIDTKKVPIRLYIIPVRDSRAVLSLEDNLSFYTDLTEKENDVYTKLEQGLNMTREEAALARSVQKKIDALTREHTDQVMIEFLAMQTKLNENSTYESMKEFYTQMPVDDRSALFSLVEEKSSITNQRDIKSFQKSSD